MCSTRSRLAKELTPRRRRRYSTPPWALWRLTQEWTTASIEEALKAALLDGLELKPRKAFGPIRVAVTGATISPPLFESMELLGRDRSLARLRAAKRVGCEKWPRFFGSLFVGPNSTAEILAAALEWAK